MNRCLSTCLLFGAILLWPLTARGQESNSSMARRAILNTPSFEAEDTSEISRRTGPSVSVRELSIPERTSNGYERDRPSGEMTWQAFSFISNTPLPNFRTFTKLTTL